MFVDGARLYNACGDEVLLRGVNKMSIWTDPDGTSSLPEIAETGANSVRIVWTTEGSSAGLDRIIALALQCQMLPMVELHDATGDLSRLGAVVDYWLRADVLAVLKKYERTLLVNIANEGAGTVTDNEFLNAYTAAVARLRAAGIVTPLVIDAPSWGQDIGALQRTAPALQAADPLHNLIFSTHIYWAQGSIDIGAALSSFLTTGQPLIIGEFSAYGIGCGTTVDYQEVLTQTKRLGIGWYAWEWGPGNRDCNLMDMTPDNRYASLQGWALETAVTHPGSIEKTSKLDSAVLSSTCGK